MIIYLLPFLVTLIFLLLYEQNKFNSNKIYFTLLLLLAFFGGFRFETGQDWLPYKNYFLEIDITKNIFGLYFENLYLQRFEIGYYFLNYLIKYLGFKYYIISFISCLFCCYSIFSFTKDLKMNKFIFLCIYISYSFLILEFAQVRQAFAIGFFLIALKSYLIKKNIIIALIIGSLGLLFQFSSLVYLLILVLTIYFPRKKWIRYTLILSIFILLVSLQQYGLFKILKIVSPDTLHDKVDIYEEEQNIQGIGQLLYSGFILVSIYYFYKYIDTKNYINSIIQKFTISILLVTIIVTVLFPGNYVMYSRMYLLGSIFQGISLSLISYTNVKIHNKIFLYLTIFINLFYYYRLIDFYSFEYLPYKSWLF